MSGAATGIVGCILAGGRSTRMGGGDKGLKPLGGRPMLARVAARLAAETDALVLNANGDPARFAGFGLPVVPDGVADHAGPLAGVLAGLDWAAAHHPAATFVVTAAADTPFFPAGLVDSLGEAASSGETIVLAASDDGRHPVFGLWPVALRADLRAFLMAGETRKVLAFVERHANATVRFPPLRVGDAVIDPFFNVNTPEDLAAAERLAAILDGSAPLSRPSGPAVIGVAGWKKAGKTTLATRLIAEFVRRGLRVASVKHAHHDADIDHPGTDSHRHRLAGAGETVLVTARRLALMREFGPAPSEPPLAAVLAMLGPADIVVVEGYKRAAIAKIEVRAGGDGPPLHPDDPAVIAIATDDPGVTAAVPVFARNDIAAIADAVLAHAGLAPAVRSAEGG